MTDKRFIEVAKDKVYEDLNIHRRLQVWKNQIHMVYYCYIAGNYKAMFMAEATGYYYEVTFIVKDSEFVVDAYTEWK